jgi:anti-anti-sigma regulatory factor
MTLRIEKLTDGHAATARLVGRIRGEHLEEFKAQINCHGQKLVLDLEEVSPVDLDVVGFLSNCQNERTELLHCSPYIHEWISRQRQS